MDPPPVRYVTTSDGYDIAYTVSGQGSPLVCMPSAWNHVQLCWQEGSAMRRFHEQLAERFRLSHYDARGQGLSKRGLNDRDSIASHLLDLEALVDREKLEQFILLAPPSSGHLAVYYAVKHPERVVALILVNCRVSGAGPAMILEERPGVEWEAFIETTARVTLTFETPAYAKQLYRESMTQADRVRLSRLLAASDITAVARELRVPCLLLAARRDAWAFDIEESAKQLAALIPNARLVLFDDTSTGLYADEGQIAPMLPVIESFLNTLPTREDVPALVDTALSARETEVLRLLVKGRSNQQIADELVISINTVGRHVSNIFDKIGAANRVEAAAYAQRHGLV